jgi:anti-anti-sigma factor
VTRVYGDLEFDHQMEWSEETLLVCLRGQVVYETLIPFESCFEAVRAEPRPTVVLDLSELTYIASAALGSLIGLRRWLEARGSCLRISALSAELCEALRSTGLTRVFGIDDEMQVSVA